MLYSGGILPNRFIHSFASRQRLPHSGMTWFDRWRSCYFSILFSSKMHAIVRPWARCSHKFISKTTIQHVDPNRNVSESSDKEFNTERRKWVIVRGYVSGEPNIRKTTLPSLNSWSVKEDVECVYSISYQRTFHLPAFAFESDLQLSWPLIPTSYQNPREHTNIMAQKRRKYYLYFANRQRGILWHPTAYKGQSENNSPSGVTISILQRKEV